ncbi:MAG TPA: ABC transporter ATP-binding protein [Candidatus Binataceae bacterium]|nr:ABC transporter ATP-binding protein [Candidatus Binataceae bacterium]
MSDRAAISAGEPAVEARGLCKRLGATVAVDDVSFTARAGEIFGLVGPDGAGKTTIMRMLAGVMLPDRGSARLAGFDVVADPERVKNHISYMPQRFGLYEDLTVEENIRFYADLFGVDARTRETHAARLLAASGMSEFRMRLAGKLSGGMKQKLGLTCALIHHPRVILLDEPTTGVDPISRSDFWSILYSLLAEGVAVLIGTAYLDEAERCNRLALLHQGRLLFTGSPAELKRKLPGAVVSITSSQARRVRAVLAGAPGVSSALLLGDTVRLVVDDAPRRIAELKERLQGAGVPFSEAAAVEPSVEDVFVATLGAGAPPSPGGVARPSSASAQGAPG